jgi:galactose mutarotase-like enzyme
MFRLRSDELDVLISPHGAELHSVKNKNGTEFMWQAKEAWQRHAPVLFPVVGRLLENTFFFNEQAYQLPQHGFARDMFFSCIRSSDKTCVFRLQETRETLAKYPFSFVLEIEYRLDGNALHTIYRVQNSGNENLYFSIGAHPGFNCPLLSGESFEDYYLLFENSELKRTVLEDGLLSEKSEVIRLRDKKLPLSVSLFDNDALVFENNQINKIELRSSGSSAGIVMECNNWPYFGIWTKKGCREFVCLEPWYGVADEVNSDQQLKQKKGIIELGQGKEFTTSFSLTFG